MKDGDQVRVSSDPRTVWPLEEHQRPQAVIELLKHCAREFNDAVKQDDPGGAQDLAMHALSVIGGLFPDPNDEVHTMLQTVFGALLAAKWGSHNHILLKATRPIPGTKKGLGHAVLGGFAISAVKILIEAEAMSAREARRVVAKILADAGCSLRKGDHGEVKAITGTAIRNWVEKPVSYPAQHKIAADMANVHVANLKLRGAPTTDQVMEYLRSHARDIVKLSQTL